jgi:hypothetical protein
MGMAIAAPLRPFDCCGRYPSCTTETRCSMRNPVDGQLDGQVVQPRAKVLGVVPAAGDVGVRAHNLLRRPVRLVRLDRLQQYRAHLQHGRMHRIARLPGQQPQSFVKTVACRADCEPSPCTPCKHGPSVRTKPEPLTVIQKIVQVHDDRVVVNQHHRILRRLEASQNVWGISQIQRNLMVRSA